MPRTHGDLVLLRTGESTQSVPGKLVDDDLHFSSSLFLPGSIVARVEVQSACEGSWMLP